MNPPAQERAPLLRNGAISLAVQLALSAGMGLAIGWWIVRRDAPATPASTPTLAAPVAAAAPAPMKVDDLPAASQKRIDAVFTLGGQQPGQQRDAALYAALLQLDTQDFLAATADFPARIAQLGKGPAGAKKVADFVEAWMDRWLTVDTPGALSFLGSSRLLADLPAGNERTQWGGEWRTAQGVAIWALARREPRWTHDFVSALKPGPKRDSAVYALLNGVAEKDGALARRILASFAEGPNRLAAVEGFVTTLAQGDPRAGFDAAMAEKAGQFRERLLGLVVGEAGKRGLASVRELLDRIDEPHTRFALALRALNSTRDPSSHDLILYILEESRRGEKLLANDYWGEEWAKVAAQAVQGPRAAEAAGAAATLGHDPKRRMLGRIASEWARKEPAALRAWLTGAAPSLDAAAIEALGPTFAQLAKSDRAELQTWADALPAGRLREQAHFELALRSRDAAQVAAAYQSVAVRDGDGRYSRQIAGILVAQDAATAAHWAAQLPESPARGAALNTIAEQWGGRDPRAAAAWLEQLPAGVERDSATVRFVGRVTIADPAAAAEWAEQVADPKLRENAAATVFHRWSWENPTAARAWLDALPGLSDEFRSGLRRNFQ